MNRIPLLLIYSRLLMGLSILLLSSMHVNYYHVIAIVL